MTQFKQDKYQPFLSSNPDLKGIDLLIPDLNGVLRGKRIQTSALKKVYQDGLCLPASVLACDITGTTVEETGLGVETGDSDKICFPVQDSLTVAPWYDKSMAQTLLSMYETNGDPFFADPRHILKNILDKFKKLGLTPVVALELEFYLLDPRRDKSKNPQSPISPGSGKRENNTQVYSIDDLDNYGEFLGAVADMAKLQGIPTDTALAEYAPGQFEINLKHSDDLLKACDHGILLKRLIKGVAKKFEMKATFMAKPYGNQAGSGMHIHCSLLKGKKNVFSNSKDITGSSTLHHAIGGLLKTMNETMALFCPNPNSYRRFQPDLYVPMAPTWGHDNRTVAVRIPSGTEKSKRIEHRVSGADANPYLVVSSMLAGIHYGITEQVEPPKISTGDAIAKHKPSLPLDWNNSLDAFLKSKIIKPYFGNGFWKVYSEIRKKEMTLFKSHVSPQELDWYLNSV